MKTLPGRLLCGFLLCGLAATAAAQDLFTYSGGNGAPLTLTLNRDIQFTLAGDVTVPYGIGFSITNAFASPQAPGGYQINILSGLSLTDSLGIFSLGIENVGVPNAPPFPDNTANLNDSTFYLFFQFSGAPEALPAGDVITLTAGSAVTADPCPLPTPVITPDATLVVHDGMADQVTTISGVVPEPSTVALAILGGLGVWRFGRRK